MTGVDRHWNYYKVFEEDIRQYSRYVEIVESNLAVYSLELTRLFLSICSEVDVLCKLICGIESPDRKVAKMPKYIEVFSESLEGLSSEKISMPQYGLVFCPFQSIDEGISPKWWREHNGVKHKRDENYRYANLGNVLDALGGLYLLNLHLSHSKHKSLSNSNYPLFFNDTVKSIISPSDLFWLDNSFLYIGNV